MSEDNTEGLPLPPESQHDLKNCFNVILNRKKLVVKRDELEAILQNNLNIDIAKLNSRLASVLADSLVMYMRMWPGWQNSVLYFTGKLMVEDWFEQFRQYLMMKINYIILNEKHYLDLLKLDNFGNTADAGLQTWQINKKEMAPYSLMIHGTPSILSDVIFMQRGINDLEIKPLNGKPWQELTLVEFLNWMHVSCEVKLLDIKLSRKNMHQFYRYVGLSHDGTVNPIVGNRIESVSKINEHIDVQVYSLDYLQKYTHELFETLRKIKEISRTRLEELKQIFNQFLLDIEEAFYDKKDMVTIATNARVLYNIGCSKYFRNKRIATNKTTGISANNQITSYEILQPKVEFALHSFEAVQDLNCTRQIAFVSLNRIQLELENSSSSFLTNLTCMINNSSVTFGCTLCEKEFTGSHAGYLVVSHFLQVHRAEQGVLCIRCRKQHEIANLTRFRWCHDCVAEPV